MGGKKSKGVSHSNDPMHLRTFCEMLQLVTGFPAFEENCHDFYFIVISGSSYFCNNKMQIELKKQKLP